MFMENLAKHWFLDLKTISVGLHNKDKVQQNGLRDLKSARPVAIATFDTIVHPLLLESHPWTSTRKVFSEDRQNICLFEKYSCFA